MTPAGNGGKLLLDQTKLTFSKNNCRISHTMVHLLSYVSINKSNLSLMKKKYDTYLMFLLYGKETTVAIKAKIKAKVGNLRGKRETKPAFP